MEPSRVASTSATSDCCPKPLASSSAYSAALSADRGCNGVWMPWVVRQGRRRTRSSVKATARSQPAALVMYQHLVITNDDEVGVDLLDVKVVRGYPHASDPATSPSTETRSPSTVSTRSPASRTSARWNAPSVSFQKRMILRRRHYVTADTEVDKRVGRGQNRFNTRRAPRCPVSGVNSKNLITDLNFRDRFGRTVSHDNFGPTREAASEC